MTTPVLEETGWTKESVEERCRALRAALHRAGLPDPELDAMAPQGARNQTADPFGATVVWYALLRGRWEKQQDEQAREDTLAEATLGDALSDAPVPVRLSVAGGPVGVYQKSFHALRFLDSLDQALREVIATAAEIEDVEVRAYGKLTESLAVRLWAWILTHPEAGLPFGEGDHDPLPPAWTQLLTPDDLQALLEAHVEANRVRVARIAHLFPPEKERESRLSLAGFLGTVAQELNQRPVDVLRRWSVASTFAQAAVAAQAAREARAHAEADARARRPA